MQVNKFLLTGKEADRENYLLKKNEQRLLRLLEEHTDKPFAEENRQSIALVYILGWCCCVVSVALAFYFCYDYASIVLPDPYLTAATVIFLLSIWELLKRHAITSFAFIKINRGRLSGLRLAVVLVCVATSFYMTMEGGRRLMEDMTYTPTLVNVDSIKAYYSAELASVDAQLAGMRNRHGEIWVKMQPQAKPLQDQMTAIRAEKNTAVQKAAEKNELLLATHDYTTKVDAWQFGLLGGCADLVLGCCLFFQVYFRHRECESVKDARPDLVAQVAAQPAQVVPHRVHSGAQPYFMPHIPYPAEQPPGAPRPVRVMGFQKRAQPAQVVPHNGAQPAAQVVHTQVVRNTESTGADYSLRHSQRGIVAGKIHHVTPKGENWYTLASVNRRIIQYEERVEAARHKYNLEPTQAHRGTLINNEHWLDYWQERKQEFNTQSLAS